jgi:PAS domain S-box-containing protein
MRILVVDDHETVREAVRSFLRTRGDFDICGEAVDGEDAVQKAKQLRPDVVVMDVNMPKLNGLNATREIRRILPDAKVVILSQYNSTELKREALNAGARAFVDKTLMSTDLSVAVENVHDASGAAQKEMEAAAANSESIFRQMIDALPAAVYTTDLEGRLTHFNQAAIKFSGRVPELGTDQWCVTWKLFHADGTPLSHEQCPMAILLKQGRIMDGLECIAERPDGTRRWFTPFPRPLRDRGGRVVGGMNMLLDITDRKVAEQANNLLAAIVDSSDDAIISKNLDGIITSWNKSAERLFGYSAKEAIGRHITLIIPPERRHEEEQILGRLRRGERVDHFETVRMRKDGTRFDLSLTISPVKDSAGRVVGASKVARDISERKRAEERERQITAEAVAANAKFRAVFEQTAVFAGIMTKDGVIVEANKMCLDACGYRAEDVLGRPFWETGWWRNFPESQEKIRAATPGVAQGIPYRETLHCSWADGTERLVDFALYPIVDDQGQVLFLHPTGVDITELKRAEENYRNLAETLDAEVRGRTIELENRNADVLRQSEQLRELSRRLLQTQDEERRRLARELHDSTGQLLAALQMNLTMLSQAQPNLTPGAAKHLAAATQIADQATKELRTTSYLLHPPLLDEMGLRGALQWYVHGLTERSGLNIDLKVLEDVGRLSPEMELAIFRIVQECLTNVHRHSGSKNAAIRLARANGSVTVEVQDAGKGMSAEKLATVQSQSSGVGLRGMHERVRQFHGKMNIESNGSGTRITVTLPAAVESRSTGIPPDTPESLDEFKTVMPAA